MQFSEIIFLIVTLSYGIIPFMSIFSPNYFDNSLKVETDFINTDQYYNDYIPELNKVESKIYKNKINQSVGVHFNTDSWLKIQNLNFRYNIDTINGISCGVTNPIPAVSSGEIDNTAHFEISYEIKLALGFKKTFIEDKFKSDIIKLTNYKYAFQLGFEWNFQ